MPFALDSNPDISEVSEAVNYLLANFSGNLSADPNTGQITGPSGIVVAYLYKYLSVKYADSFDGSLNFSNSPTGRLYYGVWNNDSNVESTNPADYIWHKVSGGFGTTKFLFYKTIGGRSIDFVVGTSAPSGYYVQDPGTAIDLDVITASVAGVSASTAYKIQSQSDPAPSGFPQITAGMSVPLGWSATLGTVSVGQVVWYTFGQYNSSSLTVNGVPPNSTYWAAPIAASVFQDIRSDNWNGSSPPTSSPSTWGTQGYYLKKSDGSVYLSNVYGRGYTVFNGSTAYGSWNAAIQGNTSSQSTDGLVGYSSSLVSGVGTVGVANTSASTGVYGYSLAGGIGIRGETSSATNAGGNFANYSGGPNINLIDGVMRYQGVNIYPPPNTVTTYLRGDGTWASFLGVMTAAVTNSGTAYPSGASMNLLGSTSTGIPGAYVGTTGSGNTVTWTIQTSSPSDIRLKEDVENIDLGLDFVKKLRPVSYRLKADPKHQLGYGFIAQEVAELGVEGTSLVYNEPDWEVAGEKGFNVVHYPSYIAVLTKAIQELTAKVEQLERKLNAS